MQKGKKSLLIDNNELVVGLTRSGKTPMLIGGLDLYYLIILLEGCQITIIELGKESLYEGDSINYKCKRLEYEVIKFEKVHYDNSYEITVKKLVYNAKKVENTRLGYGNYSWYGDVHSWHYIKSICHLF